MHYISKVDEKYINMLWLWPIFHSLTHIVICLLPCNDTDRPWHMWLIFVEFLLYLCSFFTVYIVFDLIQHTRPPPLLHLQVYSQAILQSSEYSLCTFIYSELLLSQTSRNQNFQFEITGGEM